MLSIQYEWIDILIYTSFDSNNIEQFMQMNQKWEIYCPKKLNRNVHKIFILYALAHTIDITNNCKVYFQSIWIAFGSLYLTKIKYTLSIQLVWQVMKAKKIPSIWIQNTVNSEKKKIYLILESTTYPYNDPFSRRAQILPVFF